MATFVLVHGGVLGGWCWRKITPLLRAGGHAVYTPTLTGFGERAHLLTPEVGLATNIRDVAEVLFYEDLHEVILVGHSFAGMLLAGVAARATDRLGRLIYLDAELPKHGQSFFDIHPEIRARWAAHLTELNGVRVRAPHGRDWITGVWQVTDPADVAWMEARLTPMPLRPCEEPLHLPDDLAPQLPRSYIWCNQGSDQFSPAAEQARADGWDYHELAASHLAPVTAPQALAALLLRMAQV
jgi:pimeloyl-ACP methyl ester carboxylesterase